MSFVTRLGPSADLMSGMMTRLRKAALDPREVATEAHARRLREMVLRCAACPDQPGCAALQSMSLSCETPPGFCPNRAAFQSLPDRV